MSTRTTCDDCEHFKDGKCYSEPPHVYPAVYGHACCIHGVEADFTAAPSMPILRPVAFSDYVNARRDKQKLIIELPGATLSIDPGFCMFEIYRTLQGVFCDLMAHDMRNFME